MPAQKSVGMTKKKGRREKDYGVEVKKETASDENTFIGKKPSQIRNT